jgi:non-heme chloroperoxidase
METIELETTDGTVEVEHAAAEIGPGVTLHTLEAGNGPPLIMLPGWSQTAEMFREQLAGMAGARRVIALDHRGHGRSPAPEGGYRVHRLAADVEGLLAERGLERVDLLAHSMGASVAYAYLDLFGPERIASLVLVDEMPRVLREPGWSDEEAELCGATIDGEGLFQFLGALRSAEGEGARRGFLESVTSERIDPELLDWIAEQNSSFPREQAAELILSNVVLDWRSLIPTIELPTLVVAGDSVNVPLRSQRWIAEQIAGAELAIVRGAGGGTHFPFLESPAEFNERVLAFLAARGG